MTPEKPPKMPPEIPLIMACQVSIENFRCRSDNSERIKTAVQLLSLCRENRVDLLTLPAGYLLAKSPAEIPRLFKPILQHAKRLSLSFAIGVDTAPILNHINRPTSPAFLELTKRGKIPCFLAVFSHERNSFNVYRQRSATSMHAEMKCVSDRIMAERRTISIKSHEISLLICGEYLDGRVYGNRHKSHLIFVHSTLSRLGMSMRSRSRGNLGLLALEHRSCENGLIYCFRNGRDISVRSRRAGIAKGKGPWINIAVWTIGDDGFFKPSGLNPENSFLYGN